MKRLIFAALVASLAACAQPETAAEPEAAATETSAPATQPLAADGKPAPGLYRITTASGTVILEEVRPDGTYQQTVDGKAGETGKWEQKSPESYCFTPDTDGATQECNTEKVDAEGVWTAVNAKGESAIIERIEIIAAAAGGATPNQPAPWYLWKSGLDGRITCAQTMQGNWTKVSGPLKSDCKTPY